MRYLFVYERALDKFIRWSNTENILIKVNKCWNSIYSNISVKIYSINNACPYFHVRYTVSMGAKVLWQKKLITGSIDYANH